MTDLDLNLLHVPVALDERRSVSAAAHRLHRSQPGVSVALGKLRDFFGLKPLRSNPKHRSAHAPISSRSHEP